jgi:hypothetical protein
MTDIDAIMTIECDIDATEHQVISAYQHLIDSGVVWQLQGSYGRMAHRLIEAGICVGVGDEVS